MKKQLLLLAGVCFIGSMAFGQELIENGDFSLPDDGKKYERIDSIPGWMTDDVTDECNGRDIVESNGVGWQWDGGTGIYQVIGTVPATRTRYDFSFDATCSYSYWSGDYITDVYVIFSSFAGEDPSLRVYLDTITFTVSCMDDDYMEWVTKSDAFVLEAGNVHAGEHLVFEIEIYDSRLFGYDESWSYLYYDNVSVIMTDLTSVVDVKDHMLKVVSAPGIIQIMGEKTIESTEIFDMTGRRIMKVNPNSTDVTLQVGHLNHGIYIVKSKMNNKIFSQKVIL